MNHSKHMIWMMVGMIVLFAVAKITGMSFLLALSPLICMGMMVFMMVGMGDKHDKK